MSESSKRQARQFLDEETAFRLGELTTESFHPKTRNLGEISRRDLPAAVRMLLDVDRDIPPVARKVLASSEWHRLRETLRETIRAGRNIFFTGCGATGRLSILLEAAWRRYWKLWKQHHPTEDARDREDIVFSVMAGGDFALIRSVEGFEDFSAFGRIQIGEMGVGAGDTVVAITEGGETSFVIGTAWEGLDAGANVFFVYNNPTDVLRRHVQRSREVIEESRIVKLDLATGPMAIAGSTRMQATTIELLIVAAALEAALMDYLGEVDEDSMFRDGLQCRDPLDYARRFEDLLGQIDSGVMANRLAAWIELERDLYRGQGLVTYLADEYLLDVLTDTTERSPTFMIPPFRASDDTLSPRSWAFVKNPRYATEESWSQMLQRRPRGLNWTQTDYRQIGAPDKIAANPPKLDNERIHRFAIGNEADASRTDAFDSALIGIAAGPNDRHWINWITEPVYRAWKRRIVIDLGGKDARAGDRSVWGLGLDVPSGGLELWRHLAIKVVLNTVSTITMAALGRIEGNAMTWVSPSNKKLIDRGTRLIAGQTGCDYESACYALFEAIEEVAERQGRHEEAPSPVVLAIERIHKRNISSDGKRHDKRT